MSLTSPMTSEMSQNLFDRCCHFDVSIFLSSPLRESQIMWSVKRNIDWQILLMVNVKASHASLRWTDFNAPLNTSRDFPNLNAEIWQWNFSLYQVFIILSNLLFLNKERTFSNDLSWCINTRWASFFAFNESHSARHEYWRSLAILSLPATSAFNLKNKSIVPSTIVF